eukprot:180680-Rhodomonas_salina.1
MGAHSCCGFPRLCQYRGSFCAWSRRALRSLYFERNSPHVVDLRGVPLHRFGPGKTPVPTYAR